MRTCSNLHYRIILTALMVPIAVTRFASAAEGTQVFTSGENGYSVQIPAGWSRLPDAEANKLLKSSSQVRGAELIKQEAVYAKSPSGLIAFPYVMLQVVPYPTGDRLTESQIRDVIAGMNHRNIQPTGDARIDKVLADASMGVPSYDAATHTLTFTFAINEPNSEGMKGRMVAHFGGHAMISTVCYDLAESFDSHKAEFDAIESSFKFTPDASYEGPSHFWAYVTGAAVAAAIVGLIVLIVVLMIRKKPRVPRPILPTPPSPWD